MSAIQKNWYQIYTHSNCEKSLYNKISALGVEAYLPLRKLKKQWTDRIVETEEPAFKSYLFAKLCSDDMRLIERLSGFGFFITYGNNKSSERFFPKITDLTIATIAQVLAEFPQAQLQTPKFKKGEEVVIKSGNLKGYRAIVLCSKSKKHDKRLAVKLQGLKDSLVIDVSKDIIEHSV